MKTKALQHLTSRNRLALLLLLAAFLVPMSVMGQETLTVHNGSTTNGYVPIYGYWCDAYQKCEMVYPAAELSAMNGSEINKLQFYTEANPNNWNGSFQVFLKEVDFTSISSYQGNSGATIVYEGTLNVSSQQVIVNFAQNYAYNGGNLLIGVYRTAPDSYSSCNFYGETVSGASVQGYSNSGLSSVSATQRNFLPKATFTYEYGNKPKNLTATNVTSHGATLSWTAPNEDVIGYAYQYQPAGGGWTTLESTTETSVTLYGLTSDTDYNFQVKALYPDNVESNFATTTFHTQVSCPRPVDLQATLTQGDATVATLSWTESGEAATWILEYSENANFTDAFVMTVNTTPSCSIINLSPETKYYARVKANCGGGDQSQWSNPITFRPTNCSVVTIGDDSSTSTTEMSPLVMTSNYSLTQQIYTAEEIDMEGAIYAVSFYYDNTAPFSMDNIRVFMKYVDRNEFANATDKEPLTADNLVWTGTFSATEAGWVTIYLDTPFDYDGASNLLVCLCDNTSGSFSNDYKFRSTSYDFYRCLYWYTNSSSYIPDPYNNSTSYSGSNGRNYARNNTQFDILPVAYPRPVDLQATLTEGDATTASLSWTEKGSATSWMVEYGTAADFTGASSLTVNGTPTCNLTGLTPEVRYYARVKAVSGDSGSNWSKPVNFRPTNCLNIVIGDEATTNYSPYYPVTMPYNYSLTEQIYTADEIGIEGTIYSISFYYNSSYSFSMSNLKVYMMNVTRSVFISNNNDKVSLYDNNLVWTGTLSASEPGWVTIDLDTPFEYNGNSNLLVAVYDNVNGCFTDNHRFLTTSCTGAKCLYWYSNSYVPNLTSNTYSGSRYYPAYRNNILIDILPPTCPKPVNLQATLTETDATVATLSWTENGSANDWVLQYGSDKTFAEGTYSEMTSGFVVDCTTITANLTNLTPEQRLYARVKANCGGDAESQWSKSIEFRPTSCDLVEILGNSTSSSYYYPLSSMNNYSMSQQIFTSDEIGREGTIYSVGFYYYTNTNPFSISGVKIYMKNVTRSVFVNYEKEPLTEDNLVWTGTFSADQSGWFTINLDTSFAYDGVSNLLVAVWDPTNGKLSSNYIFRVGSCTGNKSIVWYHDTANPDPTDNITNYTGSQGIGQSRNHIQFGVLPVSCRRPANLQATLDPTDATIATLSWEEKGEAINWVLEYSLEEDFTNATSVNVSGTPSINLTGLTAEAKYYARVKADCGSTQSEWSYSVEFRPTLCTYVTIGTETNTHTFPVRLDNNTSRTQQIYMAEEIGMEGLIYDISFYYKSYSPFSFDNIVMSMKNVTRSEFTSTNMEATTEDDIVWSGTFKAIRDGWVTLTLDTPFAYDGVSNLLVEFYDGYDTDGRLNGNYCLFYMSSTNPFYRTVHWDYNYNGNAVPQYISDPGGNSSSMQTIRNNIRLGIMPDTHPRPSDVEASLSAFMPTTATISWTERGEATSWTLQYGTDSEFSEGTYLEMTDDFTVDGNTITANLTGLTPETTYYARVKSNYDGGIESGWSLTCEFIPTAYITIGDGNSATSSHPVSTYYNYSFTQQIYTADEIIAAKGGAGTFTSIAFNYRGYANASNTMEGIQVYMINTDKSVFSGYSDLVALSEADKVYEGPLELPAEGGWTTLVLDNEFDYDGTNILICVIDPTDGCPTGNSSCTFYTTSTTYTTSLYRYDNSTVFDVATLTNYTANTTNSHNNIRFLPTLYPKPRHLMVDNITPHTADLAWTAHDSSVTGYEYQYKLGEGEWTDLASTTNTTVTLTELTPEGEYTFRVKALYADGTSDFVSLNFTVLATCPKPTDLQYAPTVGDGTVATLTWQQGYFEEAWVLQYGTDSEFTDGTYTEVTTGFTVEGTAITANLTSLTPEVTYYARVKADCGGGDQSYWSNVVEFTPTDVISLTVVNGTTSRNRYIPLNCLYADKGTRSQFIIPYTRLFEVVDGEIKALTFYPSSPTAFDLYDDSFKIYLAEVDFNTFASAEYYNWDDMTQVYDGHLTCDGHQMTITFDTPYYYNGGNLMIGFYEYEYGTAGSSYDYYWWKVEEQDAVTAVYSYASNSQGEYGAVTTEEYLPNTTVHYVARAITDTPRPKYLTANCVLARTATMKWVAPAENVTGYQYQYKADGAEEWTVGSTTDTVVNLTDLTVVTPYTFQVKALYPNEGESAYANVSFTTHNLCDVPTDLTATLVPYNGSMAIISWTENGEATDWVLQYNTDNVFDTESTIEITEGFEVVDGNHVSYVLTGLTEVATYVRVRPDCNEELWANPISFTPAYANFQFNVTSTYHNYVPFYGSSVNYGTKSQFIIPSEMLSGLAGGTVKRMGFQKHSSYGSSSSSNSTYGNAVFKVFVKEVDNTSFSNGATPAAADWTDWNSMSEVYTGILTISSGLMWIELDEGFVYGGDNLMVGFMDSIPGSSITYTYWYGATNGPSYSTVYAHKTSESGDYQYNSNNFLPLIYFRYIPTEYPRMDNVVTVAVTATTALFSWEAPNENVTGYAYQYKLRNEEWPEEWTTTNDTEVTLEGLQQAKHQRFRVKALYGENESVPFTVDFLTECDTYADIPFFEDFEGYGSGSGVMPYCWNRIGNNNCPNILMASGENYLGSYYLAFKYGSSSSYPDQYAILPQMQNLDDLRVKFYAQIENPDRPVVIYVGVMTDPADASTFTLVGEVTVSDYNYRKFKVSLDSYTGGDGYIALKVAPTENGLYSNLYVDNVTVEPIPSCEEPEIEEAFDITNHTATLSWTDDGASAWQVYVSTENVLPAEPEGLQTVTTNPSTINGLEAETPYYAWVRSLCGDGTYSPWSDAYTFTTEVACPIPVNLEVTNVTGHTATLNWTDLYGEPTQWEIQYYHNDETSLVTADNVPFTLSGLDAESGYYDVKVRAWCGETDGWSEWSNTVYFYTPVSCFPVTDLQVSELGTTTATLTWGIDPQQGLDNMPTEWNVIYAVAPATMFDFESENTTPQYSVYSDNSETPWSIVEDADNAHSTSHYMQSPDCYGYIEFPAYGGGAASFWAKSLVEDENDAVYISIYYDGNSSSGSGGDYKGRGNDKDRNSYMGGYIVTSDTYKKITVDLADYQGEGTLRLQLEGQIALDDITVNMPGMTVTNQTLNFNQGTLGNDVYLDGWSLEYDGDNGYLMSEANYTNDWGGAYADFPIQLGGEVTFRAKALEVTEAVEYTVAIWDWNFDEVITETQISVTDAFADYEWDLSDYSGMAYLEFIANDQPSLVIDDLTLDMPSMGYTTTTVSDNMLQLNDLQQLAVYTVGVQAHCGEEDDSDLETTSFVPALCESEDQCQISYEWNTVDGDGPWSDAYLKVIHHESGLRVAMCRMENGTSGMGYFSLCDDEVYDLYCYYGGKGYVDFTVYDPAGEVIASYAQFQSLTEEDDPYIQFTMDCDVCQWPTHLMASNLTTQSATLTWEQGGDVTSWLVSYKDLNAMGDVILNQSDWTALPQNWTPLTFDEDYNLVETEDWTPENGALVSNTMSFLFIPVSLGGQAVVTARGSEDEALLVGIYQGGSPVGMNVNNLSEESIEQHFLSEDPQQYVVDLSGYQGDGYLFLYHGCGSEPANLYLDQLVVYGPAAWSEGVVVNTTPTYTIGDLTPGTTCQARVQAVCGVGEYGNPAMVSFVTPLCNPESQCGIYYVLNDMYDDGWNNAYIAIVNGGTEVSRLTIEYGSLHAEGELPLCPGSYQFVWHQGNYDNECSFTIYDADENVIVYKESGTYPETGNLLDEPYEHSCAVLVVYEFSEGWNWWAPTSEVSVEALATAIGDYVEGVMTEDGEPVSTFVPGEMYRILVNAGCEFTLTGASATSAEMEIGHGPNWFGFIGTEMSVTEAFTDFEPEVGDKVVSQDQGFAIYDGEHWVGTLTTLVPGKGYVYVSQASETKTLYLGQ